MAEDYHGLISLPTPGMSVDSSGGKRRASTGSFGRARYAPQMPEVVSAWAIGGGALAQGFGKAANIFQQMELERQTIESLQVQQEFQDLERDQLVNMSQKKGLDAVNSMGDMDRFYEESGKQLLAKARGTHQQGIYENFLKQRRESGLNKAANHQIVEHENYKKETFQGQHERLQMESALNRNAWQQNAAQEAGTLKGLFPDMAPELAAARSRDIYKDHMQNAFLSALEKGEWDESERILRQWEGRQGDTSPGGFSMPLQGDPRQTSGFGRRVSPNTPKGKGSSDHKGIDWAVPVGTSVQAAADGIVTHAGPMGGYGIVVQVKHNDGSTSRYAHLSQANLKVGAQVTAGEAIAFSGNTGKSTGPHLHFEVKDEKGNYVNPMKLLGESESRPTDNPGGVGENTETSSRNSPDPKLSMQLRNMRKTRMRESMSVNKDNITALIDKREDHKKGILETGVGFEGYEANLNNYIAAGQIDPVAGSRLLGEFQEARDVYRVTKSGDGLYQSLEWASRELAALYPQPEREPGQPLTEEYLQAEAAWGRTQSMIANQKAAFDADPFAYVEKAGEQRLKAMEDDGLIPEGTEAQARIAAYTKAAAMKGGLNQAQASLLPKTNIAERTNLKNQFDALESNENRVKWYKENEAKYGGFWPQVMQDAKIGAGIAVASLIPSNNPQLRAAALNADHKPWAAYNLTDTEVNDLKAMVNKEFINDGGYFGVLDGIATYRFDDAGFTAYRDNMRETVAKMTAEYMGATGKTKSGKDAMRQVFDAFKEMAPNSVVSPDLAFVVFPKEYNQYALNRGLLLFKEALGAQWDFDPQSGEPWEGATFWRNHENGVILDTPGTFGLALTWDEVREWGERAQQIGQATYETYGERITTKKEVLTPITMFLNEKIKAGTSKPEYPVSTDLLPGQAARQLGRAEKKSGVLREDKAEKPRAMKPQVF